MVGPRVKLTDTTEIALRYQITIDKGGSVEAFAQYKSWEEKNNQTIENLVMQRVYETATSINYTRMTNPADPIQKMEFDSFAKLAIEPVITEKGTTFIGAKFYFA